MNFPSNLRGSFTEVDKSEEDIRVTSSGEDILFDPKDFESMKILVQVHNHTSKTRVGAGARLYGGVDCATESPMLEVRLREFQDRALVLDVPDRTATQGHSVEIFIELTGVPKPASFIVKGRASAPVSVGAGRERLLVELQEPIDPGLELLKQLLDRRQAEISAFLEAMRA